jgi:uncharacterized protein (DUF169 family)
MEEWGELGGKLDGMLQLRTPTLGVKLYKRLEDAPKVEPVGFPPAMCAAAGWSRYYRVPVLLTGEMKHACQVGFAALGFCDVDPDIKSGERNAGVWAADAKATARLAEGAVIPAGTFAVALIAPLNLMPEAPDVVVAYGSPDQLLSLIYGTIWFGGDRVKLESNGHGGTCRECVAAPYLYDELRLAITDIGERRFAMAYDWEMVAGVPYSKFARLVEGVTNALTKGSYRRPYAPWGFQPWPPAASERTRITT